jgi:hypothetical protein
MVTRESIETGIITVVPAVYSGNQVQMLSRSPVLPRLDNGCDWNVQNTFFLNKSARIAGASQSNVRPVRAVRG